ncbi:MAG: hypothetical protein INF91_04850 [Alphaproteobacteria bacterium]|nr:hypothetical protein [Alphaproteobacteria bacterium]
MTVQTSAGSTLGIVKAAPATFNVAGYEALTFVNVGEITDLGEFGREFSLVTHNPVGSRGTQKYKGSFNEGAMNLGLGLDQDDAGQVLLQAAVDDDDDYSYCVTLQDGSKFYFRAKAMSFKIGVGSVDQITSATTSLEITTNSAGVGVVADPA